MATPLRRKRANSVVWAILALVMLGLGGYGVTSFSGTRTELGHVGNRKITVGEYASMLRRDLGNLSQTLGQPIGFQQAQEQYRLGDIVLQQIVAGATYDNEATKLGLSVGDAEVRNRIISADAMKGPDGTFDEALYKQFLKSQGLSAAEFENTLRGEAARTLLQGALFGAASAPDAITDRLAAWQLETRAFTFAELLASDLAEPVAAPDDAAIQAWYDAHPDAYMRPETRKVAYIWLKPEDLIDEVEIDEAALKEAYDLRKAEYLIPERRLVARLVYPTEDEAKAAKARLDAGEVSFEELAVERGLAVEDTDLGEQTREELGGAGEAIYALTEPGVVGPVASDLGPALYAMNGILQAQETTFEEAREELQTEVGMDRARRMIAERHDTIEDALASGATLEEVAKEAGMEFGEIEFNAETEGGLAGYEAFRTAAMEATMESFPSLGALDDGGVFAIELKEVIPPTLRPLDEVRDRVVADWTQDATHQALVQLASEKVAEVQNGASLESLGLVTTTYDDYGREGFVSDAVPEVGQQVFEKTAGDAWVVDASSRVFLISLTAIHPADLKTPEAQERRAGVKTALDRSVAQDLFDIFSAAAQAEEGVVLNEAAVAAVNAQMN